VDTDQLTVRQCGDVDVEAGRGPGQLGWYEYASRLFAGKSILDAGCGLGHGLEILRSRAALAHGQDLDSRLAAEGVRIGPIEEVEPRSYDVVTSIDVIEHVDDPAGFAARLASIAREAIFLTTPNWTASRCAWPFHLREYTPIELEELLRPLGRVSLFKGTPSGARAYPVVYRRAYHAFNRLRNWAPTAQAARCLNAIVPDGRKIHSHIAALVQVG
jgi:2-polyprenyl-3-methyl-5-hydroxy-6-metoxy-1,4-benzoquinol methylase